MQSLYIKFIQFNNKISTNIIYHILFITGRVFFHQFSSIYLVIFLIKKGKARKRETKGIMTDGEEGRDCKEFLAWLKDVFRELVSDTSHITWQLTIISADGSETGVMDWWSLKYRGRIRK
jgi:hypothetical protein